MIRKSYKFFTKYRFLRFALVGGISFIIDIGVNAFVVFALQMQNHELESAIANFISVPTSLAFNFTFSRSWTFKAKGQRARQQLWKFTSLHVFNLLLTTLIISGLVWFKSQLDLGLEDEFIQTIAAFVVKVCFTFTNFLIYKFWIFPDRDVVVDSNQRVRSN